MKICIDARNLVFEANWAGTSLYTIRLIEALMRIDRSNSLTLYFNFLRGRLFDRAPELRHLHARMKVLRLPRKYADPLCDDYHFPVDLITGRFDVLHGPAYELLYHRNGRSVVTIHDLTFHLHPEWLGSGWRDHFVRDVRTAIERADLFITVSEYIKGEMIEHLGIAGERIVAIPHGVEDRFSTDEDEHDKKILSNRYSLFDPYMLSVATREPKKNLSGLLRAYRLLVDLLPDPPKLALVGKAGWESRSLRAEIEEQGLEGRVITPGYISNDDLPRLYRNAEIFLFPSFYEGFGMPLLEAMASGCPVIASRAASIPEVTADSAVLIDPHDTEALALAMRDLISDAEMRQDLSVRGVERAKDFTWDETARRTLNAYEQLLSGPPHPKSI